MPESEKWEWPVPFGIDRDSGQPLAGVDGASFTAFREREEHSLESPEYQALDSKARDSAGHLGASAAAVDDPNDLTEMGWAVLFSPAAGPEIQQALQPLLKLRREQSDGNFKVFQGDGGFLPADGDACGWLRRYHLTADHPVDPANGIPGYLLIVAPPEEIPFEFQYTLDIQWAVGRIWFPAVEDFRNYAESVVRYESLAPDSVPTRRQVAVFAPEHEFEPATQLFSQHVARPLVDLANPIGRKSMFAVRKFLGADATRANLHRIWSGDIENGPPSLLFSGSHGMAFRSGHPAQDACQGAILCQDWEGFGVVNREEYYAAEDLPAFARVHGMMHFFFACYGAGWPQFDTFSRMNSARASLAPRPMLSRLPQALLAHPNGGALAVIGHVDRAFAYSFRSSGKVTQIDSFRDATARILRGDRLGNAMDLFNQRWAALSTGLAEMQAQLAMLPADLKFETDLVKRICNQWVARDDARNYIVFGDPAVRLRVKDMPVL